MWKNKKVKRRESDEVNLPIEEFSGKNDIKRVMKYLRASKNSLFFKAMLSFVCVVLLVTVGVILENRLDIVYGKGIFSNLYLYLVINILSVCILCMLEYKDIVSGFKNTIKGRPNANILILLSGIGAVVQSGTAFFVTSEIEAGNFSLYTPVFGISVFLDLLGKFYTESKNKKNFKFLLKSKERFSIKRICGEKDLRQNFEIELPKKSVVACEKKVSKINDFIKLSYTQSSNERVIGKIALINVAILIVGVILDVIVEKNPISAVQSFAILSCLCAPISNIFIVSKCMSRCCNKLVKNGAVLLGYEGLNEIKGITHIKIGSSQIYPKECVSIKGIRAFGEQHIDNVLLYAAAVADSLPGTLNGVFEKAFSSKKVTIPQASSVEYRDHMGLVGWVNGKRVLVGNRELLKEYKVYPPSQVFEHKCCAKGQQAVYVAIHRELSAMFILSYKPNKSILSDIQKLVKNGIKLLVGVNDSCITEKSISDAFCIPGSTVKVIRRLDNIEQSNEDESSYDEPDSIITCNKNVKSFVLGILSCVKLRYVVSVISAIEVTACAIGLVAAVILILSSSIMQIGTVELLIFTVFWQVAMYGISYICGV